MTTPLTLNTERRADGTPVLVAVGELDLSNIEAFRRALTDTIGEVAAVDGVVTVDLSGAEYLDSGAINVLFGQAQRIRIIANPVLVPVLTVSGLTELVSVEAAPKK
jgi:anti-anti-sigma factor